MIKLNIDKEIEFNKIISDILKNEKFIELKEEAHHGMNRLDHSLNVARTSYLWAKKMGLDNIEEITRAALTHDFFTREQLEGKWQIYHPVIARNNTRKYFGLTKKQENMILSHMFPLTKTFPKYKESWLISLSDKYCAFKECTKYKIPNWAGSIAIFFLNFIFIKIV